MSETTEVQHTPGPWEAEDVDGLFVTGPNRNDPVICDIVPRDADSFTEEDEANARLIAAAPELLAALEEIAKLEGAYNRDPLQHARNVIDRIERLARAAIARAEGRATPAPQGATEERS